MSTEDYPVCLEGDTPLLSPAESEGEEENLGATAGVPKPLNLPESGSELQNSVQRFLGSVDSEIMK